MTTAPLVTFSLQISEPSSPIKIGKVGETPQPIEKYVPQNEENDPPSQQVGGEHNNKNTISLSIDFNKLIEKIAHFSRFIFATLNQGFIYVSELVKCSVKSMVDIAFLSAHLIKECNISVNFNLNVVNNYHGISET
jgi:hypothetical protein